MKTRFWIAGAVVAGGVVFASRGGCLNQKKAPDEQLASRFDDMCKIARANVESPETGVRKLGGYLAKHTGDMFGAWGDTLAAIETIADDDKHDARARLARERLSKPLRACERDWARFFEAVDADPEAAELVQTFGERLNRTFEIIFQGAPRFDLLRLPSQLDAALGRSFQTVYR